MNTSSSYFALSSPEEIGHALVRTVSQYYADGRPQGIIGAQRLAYNTYYGAGTATWTAVPGGGAMSATRGGQQGETVVVHVNHARALATVKIASITNPKFTWQPQAAKYEARAVHAAQKARDVLEHYWHNAGHEALRVMSVESATIFGEGFTHYYWDPLGGKRYDVVNPADPSSAQMTGNIVAEDVLPPYVVRDPYRWPYESGDWQILRLRRSRWDLMGRFPKVAEAIEKAPQLVTSWPLFPVDYTVGSAWSRDSIEVLQFYHRKNAAVRNGRSTQCLADGTVLSDTVLEWTRIPVIRRSEGELRCSPYGYPAFWEIVNQQQLYNALATSVATNEVTFTGQLIGIKRGQNVNVMQLGSALSAIEVDDEKAVWPIQLTASPPETFSNMDRIVRGMERQMNAAPISFGEAEGERQSGSSQALLSAQLTQNSAPFQQSDVQALKDGGALIIEMVQKKATMPIEVGLVSRQKTALGRTMSVANTDLVDVDRVYVDLGNPLSQTTAGRIEALQTAAQLKIPVTAEQYWEVMETGRYEPASEALTEENLNILQENDAIAKGENPAVLISDTHFRHGQQHTIVMSNLASRKDPAAVSAYSAHMAMHYCFAFGWPIGPDGAPLQPIQMDPLYNMRMQSLASGVPPAMPAPGNEPAPSAPPGNPDAGNANLPELPKNPKTNERYNPAQRTVQQ